MKTQSTRLCLGVAIGVALLGAVSSSHAQTLFDSWTNTFDTAASVNSWNHWYDLYEPSYNVNMTWDSSQNNTAGNPTSGALLCVSSWPGHASGLQPDGNYQGQDLMVGSFSGSSNLNFSQTIDASKYDSLSFDINVDPTSPTNSAGNICQLSVMFLINNYSTYTITNINIPTSATNVWTHYVCPINKASAPAPPNPLAAGVGFDISAYGGPNGSLMLQTTPTKMWIDNIILKRSFVPTPPPTLSTKVTAPIPGLNLFSLSTGNPNNDEYQRTSIKLLQTSGVGWLGQQGVTYSFTITNFPNGSTHPGYQGHIFITTGPGNASALDYNETNVIFFDVHQNSNGTAYAAFRYKVNEYSANSNLFGAEFIGPASAGTLSVLGASNVLGTWGFTFDQDTNVTVFGPGGATTNFSMRAEAVANFTEPLNLVFGAQPNPPDPINITGNVGQDVVVSAINATNSGGSFSIVSDDFLGDPSLNTSLWTTLVGTPNTVSVFPLDPGEMLVSWTLPDAGFGLQTATNLALIGGWSTLSGPDATGGPLNSYTANGNRFTLVPSADLNPTQSYFRLKQQVFTKLQVLMPGESNAPGTPTGKTGTPTTQTVGASIDVTVNAVDNNYTIISGATDTVHIDISDTTGSVLTPDSPLVAGSRIFNVAFGTAGSWTVTASDVTDPTRVSNTGSATTATP